MLTRLPLTPIWKVPVLPSRGRKLIIFQVSTNILKRNILTPNFKRRIENELETNLNMNYMILVRYKGIIFLRRVNLRDEQVFSMKTDILTCKWNTSKQQTTIFWSNWQSAIEDLTQRLFTSCRLFGSETRGSGAALTRAVGWSPRLRTDHHSYVPRVYMLPREMMY